MKQNKTVLVTGGTTGIGRELAKVFAKDGYDLVIVARDKGELEETKSYLESLAAVKVSTFQKDLFDCDAPKELYDAIKAEGIQIDILVNNAGQGQFGKFAESDLQRELDIIQLNICSVVALTHLFLCDFLNRKEGRILNLSSIASKMPGPWHAVYHGTKAFVQSFTEAIRSEVKDSGVTVTALLPGPTDTDFFNKAAMNASKAVQDKDELADPAEVAQDGYSALMKGDDMVVSGMKNKLQVALGAITPDATLADQTGKMQEPIARKKP
jgi:short-subunit dehydrogenase